MFFYNAEDCWRTLRFSYLWRWAGCLYAQACIWARKSSWQILEHEKKIRWGFPQIRVYNTSSTLRTIRDRYTNIQGTSKSTANIWAAYVIYFSMAPSLSLLLHNPLSIICIQRGIRPQRYRGLKLNPTSMATARHWPEIYTQYLMVSWGC